MKNRSVPVTCKGRVVGTVRNLSYEEQYPHDTLFHPSPAFKRLEKMIEEDDFNPSRRNQRTSKEILDNIDDADSFDNENDT